MKRKEINFSDYVNEDIYENLLIAKEHFDLLLSKGKVSDQMIYIGNNLDDYEEDFINENVAEIYRYVSKYVESYENGDFKICFMISRFLDHIALDKKYLYKVLIRNNLPFKYQDDIKYDEFGNYLNGNGDITLENNKYVHVVGRSDNITKMEFARTKRIENINRSEWIMKLPSTLMSHYTTIKAIDNKKDYDICYVWNEKAVYEKVNREWEYMKLIAAVEYGVKEVRIATNEDDFFFEDHEGNFIDKLATLEKQKAKEMFYIWDVLLTSKGDPERLDGYLLNMNNENTKQYTKKK